MKKLFLLSILLSVCDLLFAQKTEDNLIVVTVNDTTGLYNRVRRAITFTDLIIRDDSNLDTLITHAEKIYGKSIFIIAKAIISGNQIKISGAYGLGQEDFWGYPAWPKSYNQAAYFKGSEAWQVLRRIAIKLDGKMEFFKVE